MDHLSHSLLGDGRVTDKMVMGRVKHWPLFGNWIAFKVADLLERCAGVAVVFDPDLGLMYEEPAAGLRMLSTSFFSPGGESWSTNRWYGYLLTHFAQVKAPPALDRPCGPQEVETVLCKWKSHVAGRYWVGKDIHEVRHGLHGWGATADRLLAACPEEVAR